MGRDEYSTYYNRYQVTNTNFNIDFAMSGSVPIYVGYSIRRSDATRLGQDYIEMGDTKHTILTDSDGNGSTTLKGSVNMANWLGREVASDGLGATVGNDPSVQLFLHVFAYALDPAQDPSTLKVGATMNYATVWREKKFLARS